MLFTQIARTTVQPVVQRQQRRTILNWMTNYPDRVCDYSLFCCCIDSQTSVSRISSLIPELKLVLQ